MDWWFLRKINFDILYYLQLLYIVNIRLIIWFVKLRLYECCHSCFCHNLPVINLFQVSNKYPKTTYPNDKETSVTTIHNSEGDAALCIKLYALKRGPQGPHKLSSLKSLKIQNPPLKTQECAMKPSENTSSSNCRWQNRKECQNRSTNNGDMAENRIEM